MHVHSAGVQTHSIGVLSHTCTNTALGFSQVCTCTQHWGSHAHSAGFLRGVHVTVLRFRHTHTQDWGSLTAFRFSNTQAHSVEILTCTCAHIHSIGVTTGVHTHTALKLTRTVEVHADTHAKPYSSHRGAHARTSKLSFSLYVTTTQPSVRSDRASGRCGPAAEKINHGSCALAHHGGPARLGAGQVRMYLTDDTRRFPPPPAAAPR